MKNVIFADDDVDEKLVGYFKDSCENAGIEVKVDIVTNGRDLVEAVLKGNYDLVFTDGEMAHPGYDATRDIRAAGNQVPIYSISRSPLAAEGIVKCGGTGIVGVVEGRVSMEKIIALHLRP